MKRYPALDWLNFFIADVKDGAGPFLSVYLLSSQHWDAGKIGLIMAIAGTATVLARTPIGGFVDWVTWKRGLIITAAVMVGICLVLITWIPSFWPVAVTQAVIGIADAVFPPAITAISLGIVGFERFTYQVGRNEAFNHAGNVVTALVAGVAGWLISPSAVLWLAAFMAILSIGAVLNIEGKAINHKIARGLPAESGQILAPNLLELFTYKPLLIFTATITLFHFANAAMLPLLGQKLALTHPDAASLVIAFCITIAQIVMVPMALLVGRKANSWGRKPIFLAAFAVLPIRGFLYTLSQDPYYLISIQLLDGIGAGIFGALFYIVVSDLTWGTGHYNLALGATSACWGLGAALSHLVAGFIVDYAGYNVAFLSLTGIALIAFLLFWLAMPETSRVKRNSTT
ncbi:major facilitator transporter [Candidatus Nitrosoglobus terrae]|uniref:Major facilitator transporter n=1 Tax=Candidatus Nitrosoglobus terrae TaxID=1630141 RepID=A0A1Q2SPQ7_9GAMM|nr:MFS transporter [Candidatus Nitrosoglobus terrae]BAW81106.1 major facilitator transporter [Candidatus Nitrosoglobus terrae]